MKLELNKFRGTEQQFENLTLMEKRQYIVQMNQDKTNELIRRGINTWLWITYIGGACSLILLLIVLTK